MFAPDVRAYVQLLEESHGANQSESGTPIDAFLSDGALRIELDTPGVPHDRLRVHVESHVLVVEGDRSTREAIDPLIAHRAHGAFSYRVGLGDRCNVAEIDAVLADGVLSVVVPLLPSPPTRQIHVHDGALAGRAHRTDDQAVPTPEAELATSAA